MADADEHASESRQKIEDAMEDVRRAREFYRYLHPDNLLQPQLRRRSSTFEIHRDHIPSLSAPLTPFCQLTVLRCNVKKAMLNVMDRDVMYFLAESFRDKHNHDAGESYDFVEDPILMRCSAVSLKGRICEMTIRTSDAAQRETPFFVIPDLTQSAFSDMAVVTGPPYYRFYAGIPITTRDGVSIGSLAVMDDVARPNGLTAGEEDFLSHTAEQIMTYLETNRQAIEGQRSRRMAEGLEAFISGKGTINSNSERKNKVDAQVNKVPRYGLSVSHDPEMVIDGVHDVDGKTASPSQRHHLTSLVDGDHSVSEMSTENEELADSTDLADPGGEPKSHSKTFARAANLLRECMGDLGDEGIVCFQSLKSGFGRDHSPLVPENGSATQKAESNPTSWSTPVQINSKVIACSTDNNPFGQNPKAKTKLPVLDEKKLREFMRRYPNGCLWSLEDPSFSSSDDDLVESLESSDAHTRPSSVLRRASKRSKSGLSAVRATFPSARQVLFAPLWDATIGAFAHGVFVTTALETRSFNATSELSFLNAFCSTLMAECSRIDTMLADKQKSDFVGTISHEMRSPLHGVLASVEFLAETDLSAFQQSLIDTIDSCGRTLLDTINHVLDFSKVNSFQKHWQASNKRSIVGGRRNHYLGPENSSKSLSSGAPPLLQLFAVTNISAVLEEVVDGLVLGNTYSSGIDITDTSREARGRGTVSNSTKSLIPFDAVDIVLDIDHADWSFLTQPGAVRRIIMNITGNAIKYTGHGKIKIRLKLKETVENGEVKHAMVLTVADTGIGISPAFLSSKLFVPFAQENALAPGTGLGMSIVRSIVLMLGGTIEVQSTVGEGTTVEVMLPLNRPMPGQGPHQGSLDTGAHSGSSSASSLNVESLLLLQHQAADATVTFYSSAARDDDDAAQMIQKYATAWFHLQYVDARLIESVSIVVVEEQDLEQLIERAVGTPGRRPAIVVLCSVSSRHSAALIQSLEDRVSSAIEFVAKPFGPYKLARSIRSALQKKKDVDPRFTRVTAFAKLEETTTPHPTMSTTPGAEAVMNQLHDMDLNLPGETDASKLVQGTETFAASQSSHHAQMAITDLKATVHSPTSYPHTSEGSAFPFPIQNDERSRKRRESHRTRSYSGKAVTFSSTGADPGRTPRAVTSVAQSKADPINPRVLLVDDNKINLKLLETFLQSKRKYTRIKKAEDGQQAVEAFVNASEPFDIVFMDISMPVLNGFEATRAIREYEESTKSKPGAMVIALTGLASGRDQSEGFDSGCDIYMTKPVSFKEVGKLLDNWEEHQKLSINADGEAQSRPTGD